MNTRKNSLLPHRIYLYTWLFLCCCCGAPCKLLANDVGVRDSLLQVWEDSRLPDSVRVAGLYALCEEIFRKEEDSAAALELIETGLAFTRQRDLKAFTVKLLVEKIHGYSLQARHAEILVICEEAIQLQSSMNAEASVLVHLYNRAANAYLALNDFKNAMAFYHQALALAEKLGRKEEANGMRGNIGIIYASIKEYDKALAVFFECLEYARLVGDQEYEALLQDGIGQVYFEKGDYSHSLIYFQAAIKTMEAIGHQRHLGTALMDAGNAHLALRDTLMAEFYFRKAVSQARKTGEKEALALALIGLGQIHQNSQIDSCIGWAKESLQLSQSIGTKRTGWKAAKLLAELEEQKGNYAQALAAYKIYQTSIDSLYTDDNLKAVYRAEADVALEKEKLERQFQDKQMQDRISRQRTWLIVTLIGILLSVALAFAFFANYQLKRKAVIALNSANTALAAEEEKLRKTNVKLHRFSSVVAHDILAKLNLTISYANILVGRQPKLDQLKAYYQTSLETTYLLKDYCQKLLQEAQTSVPLTENSGLISQEDTQKMVEEVLKHYQDQFTILGFEVVLEHLLPLQLPKVVQLQVLHNLITNALKYVPQEGVRPKLHLSAGQNQQGQAYWKIDDNGPGIQKNSPSNNENNQQASTGMGLQLIQQTLLEYQYILHFHNKKAGGLSIVLCPLHMLASIRDLDEHD